MSFDKRCSFAAHNEDALLNMNWTSQTNNAQLTCDVMQWFCDAQNKEDTPSIN